MSFSTSLASLRVQFAELRKFDSRSLGHASLDAQ